MLRLPPRLEGRRDDKNGGHRQRDGRGTRKQKGSPKIVRYMAAILG